MLLMGGKPGAEQRLQGAQAAKGAWEELGFQHSAEENRITGGTQAWEVFPGEVSLVRYHEPEERGLPRNSPHQGLEGGARTQQDKDPFLSCFLHSSPHTTPGIWPSCQPKCHRNGRSRDWGSQGDVPGCGQVPTCHDQGNIFLS